MKQHVRKLYTKRSEGGDGARPVFIDQADMACTEQARSAARCCASRMKGGLHPAKNGVRGALSLYRHDSVERGWEGPFTGSYFVHVHLLHSFHKRERKKWTERDGLGDGGGERDNNTNHD